VEVIVCCEGGVVVGVVLLWRVLVEVLYVVEVFMLWRCLCCGGIFVFFFGEKCGK